MRFPVSPCVAALLAAGCSQAPREPDTGDAAPGINVTAAPGVAFRYRYGFRLPAARIAPLQEAHAAACERLGPMRCRITGMHYARGEDNTIDAMLAFALAPDIARTFGRDAIRAVEAAEGMLVDARITGEDAGARIDLMSRERDAAAADAARIDARSTGTTGEARAELERQRAAAAETARRAVAEIAGQRMALAGTPVVFDYRSGTAIRGFDPASPLTRAADLAVASARWTMGTVLALLGVAVPPLLVGLLGLWALLRARQVWRRRTVAA